MRALKFILPAAVVAAFAFFAANPKPAVQDPKSETASSKTPSENFQTSSTNSSSATVPSRVLAITRETAACGWTVEDAKDTNVIRRLAHNKLEYTRMVDENARIYRRQLVYHKQTAVTLIARSKLSGQTVLQMTLPGLDGQEIPFEITRTDLSPSGQQGAFSGHVSGRPDSMVTLAFKGGREAFTVLSPSDNLYLVGEPHEPGELIVKSINPETYVPGICGNP